MAGDNITPIRPPLDVGVCSQELIDALVNDKGSIEGTALDEALDEQRMTLFGAQAVLDIASHSLDILEDELELKPPMARYSLALRNVSKSIEDVVTGLDSPVLQRRMLEIERARREEPAEGES
jgi:hypothetical protein